MAKGSVAKELHWTKVLSPTLKSSVMLKPKAIQHKKKQL